MKKLMLTAVALLMSLSACGEDNSNGSESGSESAGCKEGEPVGEIVDDVPTCAEDAPVVLQNGCYPTDTGDQDGSFYRVNYGEYTLYGAEGGDWVRSDIPDETDQDAITAIGC